MHFKSSLNLNYTDIRGKSVLHHAIEAGNVELLDELMKHHVDIGCCDRRNRNILFSAVESRNVEVCTLKTDFYLCIIIHLADNNYSSVY